MKKVYLSGTAIAVILILGAYFYYSKTQPSEITVAPMTDIVATSEEATKAQSVTNDDYEHIVSLAGSRVSVNNLDTFKLGQNEISFKLFGLDGHEFGDEDLRTVKDKKMHLLIVREDMQGFAHIHPDYSAGKWHVQTDFTLPGTYNLYLDFDALEEKPTVLRVPLTIGSTDYSKQFPEPNSDMKIAVQGYDLTLTVIKPIKTKEATKLSFALSKDGQTLTTIKPYLGTFGHVAAFRQTDVNDYFHVHALETTQTNQGKVDFEAEFPVQGRYTLFAQFNINDQIVSFPITLDVALDGQASSTTMH